MDINRGGHFLLTESVKETASQNTLIEAVTIKMTVSVNRFFEMVFLAVSVNKK